MERPVRMIRVHTFSLIWHYRFYKGTVRKTLQIPFVGETLDGQRMLLVDIEINGLNLEVFSVDTTVIQIFTQNHSIGIPGETIVLARTSYLAP